MSEALPSAPLQPDPATAAPIAQALAPLVLVVDDNPATRYSTARVLRAAGYRTREAATGADALQAADDEVSAIVLDVHLPDINGFEVCRRLRERDTTIRLPVIHLSAAYVGDRDKVRGLDSGADAYMTHPADPALLVATLQALIRVRTAEEGMRRSEARFRAIYAQALNGICLIDTSGRFVETNPAMLALLKREQYEVVGRRVVDFASPQWAERILSYLEQSQHGTWRGEFPLLDAADELVHLEWNLSAHVEPGVSMAIATNVSERVELARQREELLEREQAARAAAERVSRSKDEFVAVLSHELRTPLNAILSWVHVLKQGDTSNLTRGLDAIDRNAKTQTRLISDILDVSRMDLGKLSLDLDNVDAAEIVGSAVSALAVSMRDKQLDVAVDVTGVSRPVVADPARLQQIVWNLLTNAIKFSERGGRIYVRLQQADSGDNEGGLTLTVQDEGQGIKPDFLPHLFDRFTQSDSGSNRYHGGLGLGLSIVKQLVELHGGKITALSAGAGQGATFIATLPARPALTNTITPDGDAQDSGRHDDSIPHDNLADLDVLIVEDDAEAREMLSMILRDRGARVRGARNYAEGLEHIGQTLPDVLISDIGLPGQDGYALIREVRSLDTAGKRLPAIALTAFARPEDRKLALAAGFDAHCAKPLRPNELIASIVEVTGRAAH